MRDTSDKPGRTGKLLAAGAILLAALLTGCGGAPALSSAPIPTATETEETVSVPPAQTEPAGTPGEVYFPKPSSLLYDMEAPYASLFDAIVEYYWQGYPNYFILPTFSVWGSYPFGEDGEV